MISEDLLHGVLFDFEDDMMHINKYIIFNLPSEWENATMFGGDWPVMLEFTKRDTVRSIKKIIHLPIGKVIIRDK